MNGQPEIPAALERIQIPFPPHALLISDEAGMRRWRMCWLLADASVDLLRRAPDEPNRGVIAGLAVQIFLDPKMVDDAPEEFHQALAARMCPT